MLGYCSFDSTFPRIAQASKEGCPVCSMIQQTYNYFASADNWDTSLMDPERIIEISVPRAPNHPLEVSYLAPLPQRKFLALEIMTKSGLPAPWKNLVKPAAVVSRTSDAPACFRRIQDWVAACDTAHPGCNAASVVQLPTRVIDVNPTPDGLRPFLVETSGRLGRYAALSYVWGTGLPLRLTGATLETFKSGITWSSIPKSLQDAMTITHHLGLRYLWIDALCIIQDHGQDWATEAAKMAAVYGNGYVTIAAAWSPDCHAGIFSSRKVSVHHVQVWPIDPSGPPVVVAEADSLRDGAIYARRSWVRPMLRHALQTRGWALQEFILSRRVIQYTSEELIWSCRTGSATESRPTLTPAPTSREWYLANFLRPTAFPPQTTLDDADRRHLLELWTACVEDYSKRRLTVESDKLPAISGIARAFQAAGMGAYCAGLWATDLLVGLAWSSAYHIPRGGWRPTHERPREYRAPSWSWAAVDGGVHWSLCNERRAGLRGPAAQSRVVRVSEAKLVMRGPSVDGVLLKNFGFRPSERQEEGDETWRAVSVELRVGSYTCHSVSMDVVDTSLMHPGIEGPRGLAETPADVVCLLLGTGELETEEPGVHLQWSTALLLRRVPGRAGVYERVGVIGELEAGCFKGAKETEVTII